MKKDKIVFDIETKNSFDDVGGRDYLDKLEVSVVGTYSYNLDKYRVFDETEFDELEEFLKSANLLIGFSSKSFDVPVLEKYFSFKLSALPHFDILEKIEDEIGRKLGLNLVGQANLGISKTGYGLEAIEMYKKGEIEKLKEYCLQDVKITKGLFDLILEKGYLWVPLRGLPQMQKVKIIFLEQEDKQVQLL